MGSGARAFPQGIEARRNTGAIVGVRTRINLIEGAGITIGVVDDPADDEFDITFTNSGVLQWANTKKVFLAPWGNDANAGTAENLPLLTPQAAWDLAETLAPLSTGWVTIRVFAATYAGNLICDATTTDGYIVWEGEGSSRRDGIAVDEWPVRFTGDVSFTDDPYVAFRNIHFTGIHPVTTNTPRLFFDNCYLETLSTSPIGQHFEYCVIGGGAVGVGIGANNEFVRCRFVGLFPGAIGDSIFDYCKIEIPADIAGWTSDSLAGTFSFCKILGMGTDYLAAYGTDMYFEHCEFLAAGTIFSDLQAGEFKHCIFDGVTAISNLLDPEGNDVYFYKCTFKDCDNIMDAGISGIRTTGGAFLEDCYFEADGSFDTGQIFGFVINHDEEFDWGAIAQVFANRCQETDISQADEYYVDAAGAASLVSTILHNNIMKWQLITDSNIDDYIRICAGGATEKVIRGYTAGRRNVNAVSMHFKLQFPSAPANLVFIAGLQDAANRTANTNPPTEDCACIRIDTAVSGNIRVRTSDGAGANQETDSAVAAGTTEHEIDIVWDGSNVSYYVDGAWVASHAVASGNPNTYLCFRFWLEKTDDAVTVKTVYVRDIRIREWQ